MGDGQRATPAPDGATCPVCGIAYAQHPCNWCVPDADVVTGQRAVALIDEVAQLRRELRITNEQLHEAWAEADELRADLAQSASPLPGVVDGEGA